MPGRYHFNEIWLEKDAYKSWPQKDDKNSNKGFCFACKKSINLKVMRESALVSHMKGKKHKEYLKNLQGNEKTTKIRDFFSPSASTSFSSWLKCNTEGRDPLDTQGNKEPLLI